MKPDSQPPCQPIFKITTNAMLVLGYVFSLYDWWWYMHTYTNPSTYVTTDPYQILFLLFKLTSLVVIIIRFSVIDVLIVINKFWTGLISIPIRVFINMHQVVIIYQNFRYILGLLARNLIPVSGHNYEQSSTSGHDYASDRSVIGAGRIAGRQLPSNQRGTMLPLCCIHPCLSVGSGIINNWCCSSKWPFGS